MWILKKNFLHFICVKVKEFFSGVFVWAALRPLSVVLFLRLLQHFAAKANIWVVLWCVNPSKDHILKCVLFLRLNLTGLTRSAMANTSVSTTRRRKQGR